MGIFGSATSAGPAGAGASTGGGALAKIIEPLKAIGRTIGKIFLPLTIILGVFDGYKGFEEEYKDEQSILDGLRGGIKGIVDGFIGSFVRIIGSAFDYVLTFFGLDQAGESVSTFAKDVTAAFETSVGGLVDIITGLFSFDLARVKEGVVNLIGGTIDWASDILYAPVNLAINFIRDIFGIGEEDAPAFNFKDYLFGEDGLVNQAVDFIKDIFTIDFAAIGTKFFDMGQMLKAIVLASGSYTATAMNPFTKGDNLEAASKAYEDKYNEVMGGSESSTIEGDTIQGDTSESKVKTDILNQGDTSKGGDIVIGSIDTSTKDQSTKVAKTENSYPPMTTSIDPFHDRMSYGLG
jgi:hypothetical protein